MNAIAAAWGSVLATAKAAGQALVTNVETAVQTSLNQGVAQVREAAGGAVQETGVGLGAAVAPPNTTPTFVAWAASNWELLAAGAGVLFLLAWEHK